MTCTCSCFAPGRINITRLPENLKSYDRKQGDKKPTQQQNNQEPQQLDYQISLS